ncbi:MAG: hypothetical protein II214_05285 [Alistipes sp.]|nr:hypothetical protein [Alistipes sp.]
MEFIVQGQVLSEQDGKQLGNKTKEVIEGHTPVVKELIQSVADYLKR